MSFRVIIPARYQSTRLPAKVLADISGKPMIRHVYERALASGADDIIIATDDQRVADVAKSFDANVCMTSPDHQSGTERLSEVVGSLGIEDEEIIVCLQGDEPLIPPDVIRKVAEDLEEHDNVKVASVCVPLVDVEDLFRPNVTKVVMNRRNYALYFSRAPIPYGRDTFKDKSKIKLNGLHFRHIGIYAYRAGFLQEYIAWDPCPAEPLENLEQLRVLWHGGRIHMIVHKGQIPAGIDTPEDLERVRAYLKSK